MPTVNVGKKHNCTIKVTRMEGKAQRVAARALSPTRDNWGVEVPVLAASDGMHGTNAIALVYAQHAQCWSWVGQYPRL